MGTNERHLRAWRMDPQNKVTVMCVTAASPLPRVRDRRGRCTGSGVASSRRAIRRLVEAAAWRDDCTGLGVRPHEAGFLLPRSQAIDAATARARACVLVRPASSWRGRRRSARRLLGARRDPVRLASSWRGRRRSARPPQLGDRRPVFLFFSSIR